MEQSQQHQQFNAQMGYPATNNLHIIGILHYVKAGLSLIALLFFAIYAGFGWFMSNQFQDSGDQNMPFNPASLFVWIGISGVVICLVLVVLDLLAASYLNKRKNHTFLLVVSGIHCVTGLLGIGLGVFTIIELTKPQVKELFHVKTTI